MAQAFLHGNGGGNQLNFKVVGGTTEPADPKENTIWVKTNVPIHIVEMNNVNGLMAVGVNAGWVYINIESSAWGEKNTTIQVHDKNRFIYITPYGCQQNQDGTASGWKWMDAYIYKSGAWIQFSSEFAATISVTYPEGSTLICTDGNTTLTATTTTGSYAFTVPNAGSWTVKAVSGSDSASQTVSITTSGQSEQVELSYTTYLYKNGDSCTSTGGDWIGVGMYIDSSATEENPPAITKGSTSMTITEPSGCGGACYKAAKIDLTDVTSIRISGNVPTAISGSDWMRLQVWSEINSESYQGRVCSISMSGIAGNIEKSLDVSSLSGEYYVGIYVFNGASITVYEIEMI